MNEFNKPIQSQPKDTYVSQYVAKPFELISKKIAQKQAKEDSFRSLSSSIGNDSNWDTLHEDAAPLNNELAKSKKNIAKAVEEAGGEYSKASGVISSEASRIKNITRDPKYIFAQENKKRVEDDEKIAFEKGNKLDQYVHMQDRADYGAKGGSFEGQIFYGSQMLGDYNTQDTVLETIKALKKSGDITSVDSYSNNELLKITTKKGGYGVPVETIRKAVGGALRKDPKFDLLVKKIAKIKNIEIGSKEYKDLYEKETEKAIDGNDAFAYYESVNELSFSETARKKELEKKKSEEQDSIMISFQSEVPTDSFNKFDGKFDVDSYNEVNKTLVTAPFQGKLFGRTEAISKDVSDKAMTLAFGESWDQKPQLMTDAIAFYATGSSKSLNPEQQEHLSEVYKGLSPVEKDNLQHIMKSALASNEDQVRVMRKIIDKAVDSGDITANEAQWYKQLGRIDSAIRGAVASLKKYPDKSLRSQAKEANSLVKFMKGSFEQSSNNFIFIDQNGKRESYYKMSSEDKKVLEDFFGVKNLGIRGVSYTGYNGKYNPGNSLSEFMSEKDYNHTKIREGFLSDRPKNGLRDEVIDKNKKNLEDRKKLFEEQVNENKTRSSSSVTHFGINPTNPEKYKYGGSTFDYLSTWGEVKENGKPTTMQEIKNNLKVDVIKSSNDGKFDEETYNRLLSEKFKSPVHKMNTSGDIEIFYGNGAYSISAGSNQGVVDISEGGSSIGTKMYTEENYITAFLSEMKNSASKTQSGEVGLDNESDVIFGTVSNGNINEQVLKVKRDFINSSGSEDYITISSPVKAQKLIGKLKYYERFDKDSYKSLLTMLGATDNKSAYKRILKDANK